MLRTPYTYYDDSGTLDVEIDMILHYDFDQGGGDGWNEPKISPHVCDWGIFQIVTAKIGGKVVNPAFKNEFMDMLEKKIGEKVLRDHCHDDYASRHEESKALAAEDRFERMRDGE